MFRARSDGMDEAGAGTPERPALVVVPRRPGPLIKPPPDKRRHDDLDEVLDELFGEPTTEGPGLLDAALVVGGALLVATAWLGWLPRGLGVVGAGAAALGLVLPARSVWQRLARRRAARRLHGTLELGLPLDLGHDVVRRLTDAYERVVAATRQPRVGFAQDALEAAHLALAEVAGLLRGRPPDGPAEEEYVQARASAVAGLAQRLEAAALEGGADGGGDEPLLRDSAVRALEDFEQRTGWSSLTRIKLILDVLDTHSPQPDHHEPA
jgi:hypothetical protein